MMLNREQKQAVETTEGRLLILAGAGSGKTRVIVHRIAHLIRNKAVLPSQILGLTFTNKAAAEMRERVAFLIGNSLAKEVTLSTFHSFCMKVLRKEIDKLGFTKDFTLYDEGDVERLLKMLAKEMLGVSLESLPSLEPTKAILGKIFQGEKEVVYDDFSYQLYERLRALLRSYNAVTFDSLIQLTLELFTKHEEVLARYQEQFRYLMIDEYQDTNPAQFELAETLAKKSNNLCVVGDDDQSIYGWRGAKVHFILDFVRDQTIKLEQNYRSTPTILEAANAVIAKNQNRHTKKLWSSKASEQLIEVFHAPTDQEEAHAIAARLVEAKKRGYAWKDMAILYRSNALSRHLELALLNASYQDKGQWLKGIPYEVFGGLSFSERAEIKDVLAYLRVLANPKDQEALLRILNVPRRGISDLFLEELTSIARQENLSLWTLLQQVESQKKTWAHHPKGVAGILSFLSLLEKAKRRFKENPLAETLSWFLKEVDFQRAIREEVKSEKMRALKWENVEECVNALAEYETLAPEEERTLFHFLSNSSLGHSSFSKKEKKRSDNRVQLMTLHSAKGLEFPLCFIAGLEDHILPHERSVSVTGIEEERRLFYVGMTRAKEELTLSMARSRMRMGKVYPSTPSRFLFDIPKHLLKMSSHNVF